VIRQVREIYDNGLTKVEDFGKKVASQVNWYNISCRHVSMTFMLYNVFSSGNIPGPISCRRVVVGHKKEEMGTQ
jgi:hypothetical protein